MSNLNNRLQKLEEFHNPGEKILTVIYDAQGKAGQGSSPEVIGMTREEILAMANADEAIRYTIVYIPYNGRDSQEGQANEPGN